jgi:broad specificity phosphatase PhoE
MAAQTIWITRHGNRLDFVDPDWHRRAVNPYDPPLSEDGVVQARELGRRLLGEGIEHIIASPFLRTVETAHQVAAALDLPIRLEHGACEWLNPDWFPAMPRFLDHDTLLARYPRVSPERASAVIPRFPETWAEHLARTAQTIAALTATYPGTILIVGHGASMVGITQALVGGTPELNCDFCSLIRVVRIDGRWRLQLRGDTSHLSRTSERIRLI